MAELSPSSRQPGGPPAAERRSQRLSLVSPAADIPARSSQHGLIRNPNSSIAALMLVTQRRSGTSSPPRLGSGPKVEGSEHSAAAPRARLPWHWGIAIASLSCAPPLLSEAPRGPISDERAVFLQEAGELPSPSGPCPEALGPDVLTNPEAAVTRTAFGLAYCFLKEGPEAGRAPQPTDTVRVHYTGWTPDGHVFDSSVERGEPTEFPVNSVIRGWADALVRMTPGDKARLWIPGRLAYGRLEPGQKPGTPPKGTLIFEVELLEVL